ncbi:MAG: RnfABCDGE type electron transport complex subunit D [Oscillospiraceae bacterium]
MNNLTVSSSPHISSKCTTRQIMLDVIIALSPSAVVAVVLFGACAAVRIAAGVAFCVALEWLYCKIAKKTSTIGDLSAVVTGVLLSFNVPSELPVWQLGLGAFVAIIVVKQLFGGIGCNFVNPALAGRVAMVMSFALTMTTYNYPRAVPDALAGATPLRLIEAGAGAQLDAWSLFLGNHGGMLGETSCAALLLGGVYLVVRRVISPMIPLVFIGSCTLFSWLFGCGAPLLATLSGGLFLGAVFMATDYVTTPYTNMGKLVFGLGCGLITALIRMYANSTEGVSYAILIMNLLVPYINGFTRRRPYGTRRAAHE